MKSKAKNFWGKVGIIVVGGLITAVLLGGATFGIKKIQEKIEDNKEIVDVVETPENGEEGAE